MALGYRYRYGTVYYIELHHFLKSMINIAWMVVFMMLYVVLALARHRARRPAHIPGGEPAAGVEEVQVCAGRE